MQTSINGEVCSRCLEDKGEEQKEEEEEEEEEGEEEAEDRLCQEFRARAARVNFPTSR